MEGTKATPVPWAIAKLEEAPSGRLAGEPTGAIETPSYTEGPSLPSMPASILTNAKTLPDTRTKTVHNVSTAPARESRATSTPVCLLTSRGPPLATIRFDIPTDTEMRPGHRPSTTLATYRLVSEIEGAIATFAGV